MKDYYYLLGLKQTATLEEIKDSYRRLAKKFHPDVNNGDPFFAERFKDVQEAYEILSDITKKEKYDNNLNAPRKTDHRESTITNPEIIYFNSDSNDLTLGENITFSWKTVNADTVILEPFGQVIPSGKITYKIKDSKNGQLIFILKAKNSISNKSIENKIFAKIKKHQHEKTNDNINNVPEYIKTDNKTNEFSHECVKTPSIILFSCVNSDKTHNPFSFINDEIVIKWKTSNAKRVTIEPIGVVEESGLTRVKITKKSQNPFCIKIKVFNSLGIEIECKEAKFVISEMFSKPESAFKKPDDRDLNYIFTVWAIIFIPVVLFIILILIKL